jgi:SAM-dependent methyltransferase
MAAQEYDIDFVRRHLTRQYEGVFTAEMVEAHLRDQVDFAFANYAVAVVELAGRLEPGAPVLDIGSGYGSFVLAMRRKGYDAVGIEPADVEVAFARARLAQEQPGAEGELIYRQADVPPLPWPDATFAAVTLWNVAEHIPDIVGTMKEVARALRPGGAVHLLCPNYAAFRQEAHYHLPWLPLMPRPLARWWLRKHGRSSRFLDESIYYRTHWGMQTLLRNVGLEIFDLCNQAPVFRPSPMRIRDALRFHNPFRSVVEMAGRKSPAGSNAMPDMPHA